MPRHSLVILNSWLRGSNRKGKLIGTGVIGVLATALACLQVYKSGDEIIIKLW